MKTYDKRIGFLVSFQTLIPHGGIGQFTKSFTQLMTEHGYKVDIITDKQPKDNEFIDEIKKAGANIIWPKESLPYSTHSNIFMYGDSYCYERMVNFRNAIIQSLHTNIYDILICNTYETIQVAQTLGLDDYLQIIAYTHLESQIFKYTKNPFLPAVNEMMRKQLEIGNLYIGTQSKFNQLQFEHLTAYELPIPFPEKGLLDKHIKPREGVLFIGRWEEGKGPEEYIKLIEQTKLPARVMTNANGAKKFEDRLKKISVDYKIAVSVIGKEKIDFITSCRVAFNPSTVESYGLAFLEQITQLPTLAPKEVRWIKNFNSEFFFQYNKTDAAKMVLDLYSKFDSAKKWYASPNCGLEHTRLLEQTVFHKWNNCFNEFDSKKSASNTAKICHWTYATVKYSNFVKDLNRTILCIDDIKSVLSNKHKFRIIYTDNDTYLTKDPLFEPVEEEENGLSLFEEL